MFYMQQDLRKYILVVKIEAFQYLMTYETDTATIITIIYEKTHLCLAFVFIEISLVPWPESRSDK